VHDHLQKWGLERLERDALWRSRIPCLRMAEGDALRMADGEALRSACSSQS